MKPRIFIVIVIVIVMVCGFVKPPTAVALTMDELTAAQEQGLVAGVQDVVPSARSMIVINQVTGETIMTKDADVAWPPASLTKLLTTLVVLDTKPNFNKKCIIKKSLDEVGGARLNAIDGGSYYFKDLLSATLVASANNAANAMADCVGMSRADFVDTMNKKAIELGATHSRFVDPSGISEFNQTTATDMAKIANAAFSTAMVRQYAQQQTVKFSSLNKPVHSHSLTTTNKLFKDPGINIIAGKTGYIDEALYNFAASTKNSQGQYVITVVFGSPTQQAAFDNTKTVASEAFSKLSRTLAAAVVR